jgi:methyl coenzyme M reductase gamma subunit
MTDARFEVEGREHIKVSAGEFETLRVKVEPIAGAMKGKGTLWVWFTNDARHAPVQMKSKLGFATFTFQLQKMNFAGP